MTNSTIKGKCLPRELLLGIGSKKVKCDGCDRMKHFSDLRREETTNKMLCNICYYK